MVEKVKHYTALYAVLLLYSISSVLGKYASHHPALSPLFMLLYGLSLVCMGVYAIVWQQIIKHFPLTVAYANRAAIVVFGMVWGFLLFGEPITWTMLVGTAVIFAGIILLGQCDE